MASPRVSAQVTWPTVTGATKYPSSVEIWQFEYRHEVAVITYYAEPSTKLRYKEGSPVVVTWGILPKNLETFFGTVLYVKPHIESGKYSLRVVCLGTTYPFKQAATSVFSDYSIEQAISTEVRRIGLDCVRPPATVRWPLLVRNNHESGWDYLVRLARRGGYTLFPHKGTVYCYDPVQVLRANTASHPVLSYRYVHGDYRGTLISFTPEIGNQGAPGMQQRTVHVMGVDPRSNEVIVASDDGMASKNLADISVKPRFDGFLAGQPVHSTVDAAQRAQGARADQRWVHRGKARAYGNPRIRAAGGVFIQGVNKEADGLWYIHGVKHLIDFDGRPQQPTYFLDLELLRDSHASNFIPSTPSRPLARDRALAPSPVVLRKGQWVVAGAREVVLA